MSELLDFKQAISISADLGQGQKWIRIATLTERCAGLIMLTNRWRYHNSTPILIAFSFGDNRYHADADFRAKLIVGSTYIFKKARIVYLKGASIADAYLEVWQEFAEEDTFRVDCNPLIGVSPCIQVGSIPEGYTAKEFELTESGGGVRRFTILRKGGRHELYSRTSRQCNAPYIAIYGEVFRLSGYSLRRKRLHKFRSVYATIQCLQYPGRYISQCVDMPAILGEWRGCNGYYSDLDSSQRGTPAYTSERKHKWRLVRMESNRYVLFSLILSRMKHCLFNLLPFRSGFRYRVRRRCAEEVRFRSSPPPALPVNIEI